MNQLIFKYIGRPIFTMKFKCSCDMRGMLSFHILWLLSKHSMHGEQLAQELAKRRGEKPKAGTIYPALKVLREKGLIKGVRRERIIVYTLTPDGKRDVKYAVEYFQQAYGDILRRKRR